MKCKMKSGIAAQLIATAGAMALVNQMGIIDGWTSPNIARLTQPNATIPLTLFEAAWLASYLKLARFVSVILMPIIIELAGSKKAVLYSFIPVSVSWVLTMTANSATYLYIARFLSGITYGLASGYFPIYLGEVLAPAYRGTLTAIACAGWPLGVLVGTAAETHLSPVVSCTLYLVPCLLGIILFLWLPESPYQLVKDRDFTKARESLAWYRGHTDTETEMEEIVEFVESTSRVTFAEKMKQFRLPATRKAVIIVTLLFMCPQVCGVFNVFYYMEIILTDSKTNLIKPSDIVVYSNVILFVSSAVSVNLIDKLGRRLLLTITMTLMTIAYFGLGFQYYLRDKVDEVSIQSLSIASIIMLIVPFSVAFGPVMNALLGELFPSSIKSTAAMIVTFGSAFTGFISTLAYQHLLDAIGEIYVFWIYGILMALTLTLILYLLPETKGKSLQEIQNVLRKK